MTYARSWTSFETFKLVNAVNRYGRDWNMVTRQVGTRTRNECQSKVKNEVLAGRMEDPSDRKTRGAWTAAETVALVQALAQHGRNWPVVSCSVGTKSSIQCQDKVSCEVNAERMMKPSGYIVRVNWTATETDALVHAVLKHGRNWHAVSRSVGTKNSIQCRQKVYTEVAAGRMDPLPVKNIT